MDIKKLALDVSNDVIKWRRDLHQIPEVGINLPQTSRYICKVLNRLEISYKKGIGLDSAIVGVIEGGMGPGKTLALRADMDALEIEEKTGLPFASTNKNMHACGHDAHMAILLGAAKILNEIKEEFAGKVVLLFQPAEEISAGAEPMIKDGALEGVDAIIGIHVGNISPNEKPGTIAFRKGPMMACLDRWTLKIRGTGAHGAYPHNGKDPIIMAGKFIGSVQTVISRELDPVEPGVITVGMVNAGTAYNIIPEEVYIEGTARAVRQETREFIAKRIGEIAELTAKISDGNVKYDYIYGAPPVTNDPEFTTFAIESATKVLGKENVVIMDNPVMGGEDFAYYLQEIPGTFAFLSNPLAIDGVIYPHHNSKFALDEGQFYKGVSVFVQTALDYFNQP